MVMCSSIESPLKPKKNGSFKRALEGQKIPTSSDFHTHLASAEPSIATAEVEETWCWNPVDDLLFEEILITRNETDVFI